MAILRPREFGPVDNPTRFLLIVPENETESQLIDAMLGNTNLPIAVEGEVTLADGYGEHYIRLEVTK